MPIHIAVPELVARYEVILLDAYGVINDSGGALPSGRALLEEIARQERRFLVVTNDASRLPETCAARYRSMGLGIDADSILTSGMLLAPYFAKRSLQGARCMVLGPADSAAYVAAAGGEVVPIDADSACDVLVVADDAGYPFLPAIEDAMAAVMEQIERGQTVELILPNPDLIYPKAPGRYGFTSGAVARLIELGLGRRYPERTWEFTALGKPHRPIFDEARRRASTDSLLMIGDQLETDIAGASGAGVRSALITAGVSQWKGDSDVATPDYLLSL